MESQKTLPSDHSVAGFIAAISRDDLRDDAQKLCGLLVEWTGEQPAIWGREHRRARAVLLPLRQRSGGTAPLVGFAPRKANLVLYLVGGVQDRYPKLLEQLGPHRAGKGACTSNASTTSTLRCSAHWSTARCGSIAARTGESAAAIDERSPCC